MPVRRLVHAVALLTAVLVLAPSAAPAQAARHQPTVTRLPVSQLKIMNYYPANAGWTLMWTSYSHARTAEDFRKIRQLGANTVRVIVQPGATGYPTVSPTMRHRFDDVLGIASRLGLHVQLTLFDWWSDYADISGSQQWLRSLLAGQSQNPTVVLVELRNEMPLTPASVAWADAMLPYLHTVLPGVPRTISAPGVSGLAGASAVLRAFPRSMLDVVDVHYYGEPSRALEELREVKRLAGGRPVIVGEAGTSTNDSVAGDQAQARFFAVLEQITRALHVPAAAPWILSDFTRVPSAATPRSEYYFGLRRANGTWKRAAGVVRAAFHGRVVAEWDGGFEHESSRRGDSTLGSWTAFDAADGAPRVVPGKGMRGSRAICYSQTGGSLTQLPSVEQAFPVLDPAERFRVSAHVRRVLGTGAERVSLASFGSNGQYLGQFESAPATAQRSWQRLRLTAQPLPGASTVQVHLKTPFEAGEACWDDVTITSPAG